MEARGRSGPGCRPPAALPPRRPTRPRSRPVAAEAAAPDRRPAQPLSHPVNDEERSGIRTQPAEPAADRRASRPFQSRAHEQGGTPLARFVMADQSEEKTLPASDKKLRDARRKGQVPHSKDMVSALTFVAAMSYVLLGWAEIDDRLRQLLDLVATAAARPFTNVAAPALALAIDILLRSSLLLGAAVVTAAFIGGIAATSGPVLAFEPLQPKLERINPAEGLKRLFSVKGLVEFLKTLVKLLILAPPLW